MTRFYVVGQFACVLWLLACPTLAGDPPRHSPGGSRDPFFEALGEVHRDSPNKELFDLLSHESIRQEIHLSDEHASQIRENIRGAIGKIFELRAATRDQNKDKQELKEQILAVVAPFDQSTYDLLKKNADFDRLIGIYVQARNNRAALNQEVASKIGLEGPQLDDFRLERSKLWRSIMEETRDEIQANLRWGPQGGDPQAAIRKLFEQAERQLDAKLGDELTSEQRSRLQQLKGEAFDLPRPLFDHSRGGRPGEHRPGERGSGRGDDKCNGCGKDDMPDALG